LKWRKLHPWNVSPAEALKIQEKLRPKIILRNVIHSREEISLIAGADAAYFPGQNLIAGGVVVMEFPSLKVWEESWMVGKVGFPYVPGLLSFREAPILLSVFSRLKKNPQVVIFDGQGIAHPRHLGIATHMGLLLDLPTIGCAKSRLIGEGNEPVNQVGAFEFLYHQDEIVGAILRTRKNVKPVLVSPGYKIDLKMTVEIILASCGKYRLPEPSRLAHRLVRQIISQIKSGAPLSEPRSNRI